MTSKTITDRAGDTLRLSTGSLTAGPGEITIKVTERFRGREAVAAVHVDPAALRAALDGVAPLGKYTRTTPDPDDMDGGVAAALIEKDAEKPTAADFATAEFARHAESGGVGMRKDAGDPNTWCVAYENPGWRVGIRSDIEMARDGWSPVRECPDPEQHDIAELALNSAGLAAHFRDKRDMERARAEKAEDTLSLVQQQRDQANARAERAEAELDSWMTRAYEAEQRAWRAEARIKAVRDVLDQKDADLDAMSNPPREHRGVLMADIRRALEG